MDQKRILNLDSDLPFLIGLTGLATKWYEIGVDLGVPVDQLEVIQENSHGSVDMIQKCLRCMFTWWLRNKRETSAEKLIIAVHAVGKHDIEKEISQKYSIHHVVDWRPVVRTEFNLPVNIQKYCDDMKTRYLHQSILPESDWPPSLGGQYIRLALISQERSLSHHRYKDVIEQQIDYTRGDYDKILEYKTRIELEAAFKPSVCAGGNEIYPLKVLIDGAPGVGKTTLSRKVSRMWAEGKLLKEYWLVILLHLRESAVSKAKTIGDFFYHEDSTLQCEIVKFVIERSGDGVLIIFDGFDELCSHERSEQSLFLDVSRGKILPKCAVVVTSRPYASRSLQELPSINRHIEVLGFTEEQVISCIRQKITDQVKAEELCVELKDRLDIASICQIPLNCSIVLYVYEQEQYTLPHTLTEVYNKFILHTLKRFIKRTLGNRAADKLRKIRELPSPSRKHFELLCSLAIEGLEIDKLVFPIDDLKEIFPTEYQSDLDLPVLDLMTSAKSYSVDGCEDTYNFLHLTIQEFLAAYWLAHYSTDASKLEFYQNKLKKNRFRMVLLFLSGMTKLGFPGASSIFSLELWEKDPVLVSHLCYESQSGSLCKCISEKCFNSESKTVKLTGSRFESLVVSKFVVNSDYQWAEFHLKSGDIEIVHKVFKSVHNTTLIKKMIVSFQDKNNNLVLLTNLEELNQVNRIYVIISINGGSKISDRKQDKEMLNTLARILSGPNPLKSKHYSITLAPSRTRDNRNKVVAEFCEILAQGIVQNNSVTEIILNSVVPQDIKPILKKLSSNLGLVSLVCKQGSNRNILQSKQDESREICTILETVLSSNTSLKHIKLNFSFNHNDVSSYIETIASRLVNNTTLQSLIICPEKVVFERNQETGEMEFKGSRRVKLRHNLLHASSALNDVKLNSERHQNTGFWSLPPLAKRPSLLSNSSLSPSSCLFSPPTESAQLSISSQQEYRHGQALECSPESPVSIITDRPQLPQVMTPTLMPLVQNRHNAVALSVQSNVFQDMIITTQTSSSYLGTSNTFVTQYHSICSSDSGSSNSLPTQIHSLYPPDHFGGSSLTQTPPCQFTPQPLANLFIGRVPEQEPMACGPSSAQSYPPYSRTDDKLRSQVVDPIGETQVVYPAVETRGNIMPIPVQHEWQHRPMQASVSVPSYGNHQRPYWPLYYQTPFNPQLPNHTQYPSATCVIITTTSTPSHSSSSH